MWWEVDCNNTKMTRFDKLLNWCHNATNLTVLWKDMVELKQVVKMATCHFLQNMFRVLFLRSEWSRLSCRTVRMGVSENGVHPRWQFWQEGTWWSTIKLGGFAKNFRQTHINLSYFHVDDTNNLMSSMLSWNATEMLRPGVRFYSTFSYSRFQVDLNMGNPSGTSGDELPATPILTSSKSLDFGEFSGYPQFPWDLAIMDFPYWNCWGCTPFSDTSIFWGNIMRKSFRMAKAWDILTVTLWSTNIAIQHGHL